METTKNKLSQQESIFFEKLRNYLDTPLYFYGSIQRDDYLPQHSDIDVNIFSNDEKDIIIKLQNFLNVDRNNFKKTLLKMNNTNIIIPLTPELVLKILLEAKEDVATQDPVTFGWTEIEAVYNSPPKVALNAKFSLDSIE